jgi:zinc/manganese transport system permease protein
MGGLLVGLNLLVGVFGSCIAVALAIGSLGGRGRGRDVAIGTVFAWVLGLGLLFLSIFTSSHSASAGNTGISVLFGSILGMQPAQASIASAAGVLTCIALLAIARPLLFVSLDPEVATSRGVPIRALTAFFLVLVAITVAESVQAVGALLVFGLMVTPAAVAQNLTTSPYAGMAVSVAVSVLAVWVGLTLAFYVAYPVSFFITALAFGTFIVSLAISRRPKKGAPA